jgi:hypothetical protein
MSCIRMGNAIITVADCYRYKGVMFEWHHFCGPMPLRNDGEPSQAKRQPSRAFYAIAAEWHKLPKEEREKYRI